MVNKRQTIRHEREARLEKANALLQLIAITGLSHLSLNGRIAHFEIHHGRLWYCDQYDTVLWCAGGKPSFDRRFGYIHGNAIHRALSWIIFRLSVWVWDNKQFKPKWIGLSDDYTTRTDILKYGKDMDIVQNAFIVSGIMNKDENA